MMKVALPLPSYCLEGLMATTVLFFWMASLSCSHGGPRASIILSAGLLATWDLLLALSRAAASINPDVFGSRWELARYEVLAMMKKLFMKERNGRNYQTSLPRNLCQYSTAIQTCRSATESLSVLIGTSFSQSCGWQRINGQHAILRQERDEGK